MLYSDDDIDTNIAERISETTRSPAFLRRLEAEQGMVACGPQQAGLEFVEECIFRGEPLLRVLRLACLCSVVNGGIKQSALRQLKRELLHTYGFELLFTLANLERAGLLRKQDGGNWSKVVKALNLVVEDVDEANPQDIAYVFSGYAPLSVRLVQQAVRGKWRQMEEVLRLLPGPTVDETQASSRDGM